MQGYGGFHKLVGEAGLCETSEPRLHPSSLGHRLQLPRNGDTQEPVTITGFETQGRVGGREAERCHRSRDSGFKVSPLRPHKAQGSKLMGRPASGSRLPPLPQFPSHLPAKCSWHTGLVPCRFPWPLLFHLDFCLAWGLGQGSS